KGPLRGATGGHEILHDCPRVEVARYPLVAPEPNHQHPHDVDEIYIVLEGRGTLDVEGTSVPVHEGHAVFVEAGAKHQFTGYEQLSVLVIFERWAAGKP